MNRPLRAKPADPGRSTPPIGRGKAPALVWRRLISALVSAGALLLLIMVMPGSVLVLFFAMLPTGVAYVIDSSRGRYAASSVGGMNFAAAFPVLFSLWLHGNGISTAGAVLTDPFIMAAIYAAAAFGWMLHLGIPVIACAIHRVTSVGRIARLRMRQQELIEAWGEEVAQPHARADPEHNNAVSKYSC